MKSPSWRVASLGFSDLLQPRTRLYQPVTPAARHLAHHCMARTAPSAQCEAAQQTPLYAAAQSPLMSRSHESALMIRPDQGLVLSCMALKVSPVLISNHECEKGTPRRDAPTNWQHFSSSRVLLADSLLRGCIFRICTHIPNSFVGAYSVTGSEHCQTTYWC